MDPGSGRLRDSELERPPARRLGVPDDAQASPIPHHDVGRRPRPRSYTRGAWSYGPMGDKMGRLSGSPGAAVLLLLFLGPVLFRPVLFRPVPSRPVPYRPVPFHHRSEFR